MKGNVLLMAVTVLAILAVHVCAAPAASGADDRMMVKVTGQAPADLPNARDAAIEDALRRAVEVGGGVEVWSESETREFMLIKDVIYTECAGLVETYRVLRENPNEAGLYTVRVEAVISRGSLKKKIAAWKALIRRQKHPRVMVVGSVDKRLFETRLTAEIQGDLARRGLTVIDLEMLNENQRRDAERAAKGEADFEKAALIAQEVGADYFVLVVVEGTQYPPKEIYGVKLYEVDATGILKIIAVDSSRLIASEVVNTRKSSRRQEQATRQATTEATKKALTRAVGRLGAHWLEGVDGRRGGQITIMLTRCPFDRLTKITKALETAGGIKQVIVDSIDATGRSQIRVITNDSAINIAAVLKSADAALTIDTLTQTRIDITVGAPPYSSTGGGGGGGGGGGTGDANGGGILGGENSEAGGFDSNSKIIKVAALGVLAGLLVLVAIWKLAGTGKKA